MSSTITGPFNFLFFDEDTVNATPQLMDGDYVFTASGSLAGGRLVVGGLLAEDRVSILHQGTGAGQISVSGTTISYGGVAIGTASGGEGSAFTVTFNTAVTGAAVDALIQRLAYGNVSDVPTWRRNLSLDVVDAGGGGVNSHRAPAFTALTGSANPFNGIDVGFESTPSFVDLDGDGLLDLVSGGSSNGLGAWRNTGSATAPAFTELTGSANPFGIRAGPGSMRSFVDLDGDGLLDLVSGAHDGTLCAWRNTGSATAPAFTELTGSANPFNGIDVGSQSAPSFVDLDGDGRLDLVSGEIYGTLLAWRNTGSATAPAFTALTGSANPFNGIAIELHTNLPSTHAYGACKPSFVDLDRDGRLDLVVGSLRGDLLAWRNTGSATMPAFTELTGSANPFDGFFDGLSFGLGGSPSFVDLDGDGLLDLVSGAGSRLRTWQNTTPMPGFQVMVTAENDAPRITSGGAASFAENGTVTAYQAVGSDPEGATLVWTLGGADADLFSISSTGAVAFKAAPNFEAPTDAGGNNVYDIIVTAFDRPTWHHLTLNTSQNVAITVTNVNDAPSVTSGGTASFAENGTGTAYQATGSDPEGATLSWALGGADAALFSISSSGAVTFRAAPNFEAPADAGGNNVYDIIVTASDGTLSTGRNVAITVTNVNDAPSISDFASSVTFAENTVNAASQLMDSDVVFTLGDRPAGGRVVVRGLLAEDRVSILHQGTGAGQISVSGTTISYGGVAIGTASGGEGSAFTVTFNTAVTGAAVDALIQRLAYGNVSDAPTATRSLTLDVVDAGGVRVNAPLAPGFTAMDGVSGRPANPFSGVDVGFKGTPSFVDLDGDGRLDLVSGNNYGTLRAWRNTGSAGASAFTELTGSVTPFNGIDIGFGSTPSFVDLNGDGRLDLVSGAANGTLRAWRNMGSATAPTFKEQTGSANPFNGIDVGDYGTPSFVDLDGDGLLDLVSGAHFGTLRAWRNTGSATAPAFTEQTGKDNPFNLIDVGSLSTASFADLDSDGLRDLVSGNLDGTLLVWRNTGRAGAPAFTALTGSANPFNGIDVGSYSAPSFVDLDGDGLLDLVSGELHGTLLAWRNTTPLPSITVSITAQNDAPAITSAATAVSAENRPAGDIIYQATATDPDVGATLNMSLSGTDAALFTIDATTGAVRFRTSPNFEAPADTGGNNVYDLIVIATDNAFSTAVQAVAVTVTDAVGPAQLGTAGPDALIVGAENALLLGFGGNDTLTGGVGSDTLFGGDGNDTLSGDAGNDVAIYSDARTAYRFSLDNGALIVSGPTGTDRLQGIESLRFGSDAPIEVSNLGSMNLIEEMVAVSRDGVTTAVLAERYSGPVEWLEYQMLGIDGGDVMIGTSRNDFFNLLGGDDAANGGDGDDVIDGGSGSNFLTGGTGRDDFFLDGRGGTITWATITDWQATERLSVWGWRPGVSTVQRVDSAGAPGWTGVTMHGDLDANGVIDTSVTWTGMTAAQLPTPLEYEGLLWFV